jgi:hypothetical protein
LSDEEAYAASGYRHFMTLEKFKAFRLDCSSRATHPEAAARVAREAALDEAALVCDVKFLNRGNAGFPREASAARACRDEIRSLKSTAPAAPDSAREAMTEPTDAEILADATLRYHFGLNGGKGPVSPKGWAIVRAVLAILATKGKA